MKNDIYRSAAQVTVFSTVEKGLSFLYRIALTRIIGAEGLGIYQICLTVFAVFLTAASSGVPVTVSRLMAKSDATGDREGKHAAVTAGILCTLCVTVPAALILFFGKNAFGFLFSDGRCADIFIILLPGLVLTSVYSVIRGSFWGNKQFLPYSVIELLEDAVMVICGVILIRGAGDPVTGARYATVAVLISYVFSFCVSLGWYFSTGGRLKNPKSRLKPLISSSVPITAMRTSASLLNSAVAFLLPALLVSGGMGNSEAVSLYGVCLGMAVPMLFIPSSAIGSIAVVVAPELSENYYKGDTYAVKRDVEKSVCAAILIAVAVVPLLFALGGSISEFLYSSELCGQIVTVSAVIVLPMCVSMMTNTVLNSMNCEKKTLGYFCIGAAAMLASIVFLTRFIGVYSYILGLAASNLSSAVLNLRLLKKKCGGASVLKYVFKGLAAIAGASLFGVLATGILNHFFSPFVRIIIGAPLILAFTAALCYLMKMFTFKPLKKLFKRKNIKGEKPADAQKN